jgi:hypothetical protein
MHWLLLLAVLSSTTSLQSGGSSTQMNRLAENALRQKLGGARNVRVEVAPGQSRSAGDYDRLTVNLDGFAADRLMDLANRNGSTQQTYPGGSNYPPYGSRLDNSGAGPRGIEPRQLDTDILGQVLGGVLGGNGSGDLGGILGGVLKGGRIGRLQLRATNFTYGGAQYDLMSADIGEIRFDWGKALRGDLDIKSIQPGSLLLQLRGDQAARLIAPRLPSVRDVKVRFADGRAFVGAKSDLYGLRVPFEVGARLSVTQNQVRADGFQASIAKLRLPSIVLDEITRGVNPLYDFDPQQRWPITVELQTAGTANNALAMRGGVRWVGFNRRDSRDEYDRREQERRDREEQERQRNRQYPDPADILGGLFGR